MEIPEYASRPSFVSLKKRTILLYLNLSEKSICPIEEDRIFPIFFGLNTFSPKKNKTLQLKLKKTVSDPDHFNFQARFKCKIMLFDFKNRLFYA